LHSGFNTFLTALKGGVLNPSARINEKNITDGYISIKSKKALKKYYDNKGWIAISTKLLKNNIQIHDIVAMINKSRENKL
jgi:hypothetical protein